ncbi:hypothetical protein [Pararhodobacter marinus]|uniref:hypothetical protein n=1 Tax=Pararhodobacter marinus TaxID=2184063 RepID=UPI003511FE50
MSDTTGTRIWGGGAFVAALLLALSVLCWLPIILYFDLLAFYHVFSRGGGLAALDETALMAVFNMVYFAVLMVAFRACGRAWRFLRARTTDELPRAAPAFLRWGLWALTIACTAMAFYGLQDTLVPSRGYTVAMIFATHAALGALSMLLLWSASRASPEG